METESRQGTAPPVTFRRLCIIGVGLIGGSLAAAARAAGLAHEIVGAGRSQEHLGRAVKLGVIDRYETDIARAVAGADLIVVAVPLGAVGEVFQSMAGALEPAAVVTDVGSAKACVVDEARLHLGAHLPSVVPGHPIAGTERSGVEAAFAGLFADRRVILTPIAETSAAALAQVRGLWEAVGATVTEMAVQHHDEVLAATSHLPHLLAYALVDVLAAMDDKAEIFEYAASGFRDFTRIASSDPRMWHDICLANRAAILAMIGNYQGELARLADAIHEGDSEVIMTVLSRAKNVRDRFCGD